MDYRKDGVKAHRYLSKLNREKEPTNNPFLVAGKKLTSEKDIAKCFCSHYAKVGNFRPNKRNGTPYSKPLSSCTTREDDSLFNAPLHIDELDAALQSTPKRRSAGPDEILPEFLINMGTKAKYVVLKFLNLVWLKHYPAEWRKAEVVPIIKKGKPADHPSNFRPISLTSVFSKVYERILLRRLQCFLERGQLISLKQAGFQKNRTTLEHVVQLSQDVKDGFHRKQSTLAVLVDFKTAFDRVWRGKLLEKISLLGIGGRLFSAIASFLAQRFIRVRYQDATSPHRQTRQGIPQGSVLSPCLFNIMINDVIQTIEEEVGVKAMLFADDLIAWATSSNIAALETCLNKVLEKLKNWADTNEMIVNPSKTECQLFTLSTKPHRITLVYDNKAILQSNASTYLGVALDNKLSWSEHIKKLSEQGEKRCSLLRRLTGTKWGASQDVLSLTYKAYVRPALEYGAELTITASDATLHKLDLVQNKALRVITGGPRSTPIEAMEVQSGIEPLKMRREKASITLYERLKRNRDPYWETYKPACERLKSQQTFLSKTESFIESHNMPLLSLPRQRFLSLNDLTTRKLAGRNLSLSKCVQKGITPDYEMRAIFLETLSMRYPPQSWLHVYTDGSALGSCQNAGAGVFSKEFKVSAPVGKIASNFEGEICAILLALRLLVTRDDPYIVILVDSQAAMIAVTENRECELASIIECRQLAESILSRGAKLIFQWCPSHCGIAGNEEADTLAKEGAKKTQPQHPLTLSTAKRLVRSAINERLKDCYIEKSQGKSWDVLVDHPIPHTLSRKESVACFRLQTGHDYLANHLHRIKVFSSPTCILCYDGVMTAEHIMTCPSLGDINFNDTDTLWSRKSNIYWAARNRMANRRT